MDLVFRINRARNAAGARIDFEDDDKKDIFLIEGGSEMQALFTHVGKVTEDNTYEQAIVQILNDGVTGQQQCTSCSPTWLRTTRHWMTSIRRYTSLPKPWIGQTTTMRGP